ncbi:nucleotidyltransferase domain-containing protein [Acidithiobacillus ferriphilus]|jgi:predicted nucleotidyltransferase|uniref:Polymerase beta nucleotidyltransferase domain-containing protein n=2 Tax=Acidithiobacillus TaxID=119977 RepID=A0A179BCC2_ACIFR|nr:nucleotidyltransferase domain-containing protein [Acidithiobacillus ferriphilus]OAP89019.1 hypothetical protein A4H96_10995 [Acidithiobacillus ferrooxidans]MBU2831260.1 nucleotidyltransferase domain-containing protein [Acidithiobacillus ferriphilus]MBU2834058.1 nucleotidyltransferase domain-containing protein [Acidithiobacillus ferriphilus]MBU2854778.1 nucleotidyltransferase domain-containing protein [Acidithiobacillus ferriphilus]MBW9249883.1 hypothetical protein [Acidithiobacillus ferriph
MLAGDRIRLQAQNQARSMRNAATVRIVPLLKNKLDPNHVWIFGSVARGEPSASSDIDILVEMGSTKTDLPFKERLRLIGDVCDEADVPFHCDIIAMTRGEIQQKIAAGNHFFVRLWHEKEAIYER